MAGAGVIDRGDGMPAHKARGLARSALPARRSDVRAWRPAFGVLASWLSSGGLAEARARQQIGVENDLGACGASACASAAISSAKPRDITTITSGSASASASGPDRRHAMAVRHICAFRWVSIRSAERSGDRSRPPAPGNRTAGPRPTARRAAAPGRCSSRAAGVSAARLAARVWRIALRSASRRCATSRGSARDVAIGRVGLARDEQKIDAIVADRAAAMMVEAGRLDHARQRACREMIEMLVDEPFLDNVVAADQGDIGRVDDQQVRRASARGSDPSAPRRVGEMLDRVAGMDDVEAASRQASYLRCAPGSVRCAAGRRRSRQRARRARPRRCVRVGRGVQKGAGETAAIGADIEQAPVAASRSAWRAKRIHRRLGAKAFAVAHIAPVGAARHRCVMALAGARSMRGRLCTSPQ